MDELISNGFRFDLDSLTPFPVDFSIMDLLDPSKRQRSKSKSIKLRGTVNNCSFFINNFNLNVTGELITFDPTKRTDCIYYKNGLAIMPDGVMQLNECTIEDEEIIFNITIYSDSVDIFLILSTVDITDLDWSDYNHILNRDNIKDSWTTLDGTGYRYPLIERGNNRAGTTIWNTTDLIPYVHFVDVLERILDYAGITFTSTFLTDATIKKILYGYGGGDYIQNSLSPADISSRRIEIDNGDFDRTRTLAGFWNTQYEYTGILGEVVGFRTLLDFGNFSFNASNFTETITSDGLSQYLDGTITIQRSGNYRLQMGGVLNIELTGGNDFESFSSVTLNATKNGLNIFSPNGQNMWLTQIGTTEWEFDIQFDNTFYFLSGDEINFRIDLGGAWYSRAVNTAIIPVTQTVTTTTDITIDLTSIDSNVTDGSEIVMSKFIPPMKCSEFLIGAMKMFYLTMSEPNIYGAVKFEALSTFYQGTNVFDDITKLIDHTKEIKIEPIANKFPKIHKYEYKENKDGDAKRYFDEFARKYGDYLIEQGSFYAKGENKVSLPWSSIVPYEITTGIQVPRFITIDNNGAVKPNKGAPRVCMWNGLKNGEWTFRNTDDITDFEVLTTYPCIHHFDNWEDPDFDLNYQLVDEVFYPATIVTTKNTFTEYYSQFINEVTSPVGMFVECYVKWSPLDVQNRDFSKLIMIDGALFRLNKIAGFDSDKASSVKIELVKVLEARKRRTTKPTGGLIPIQDGLNPVQPSGFDSVDDDAPVIGGGKNTTLINSRFERG